ncbi:MAG TPA: 4-alpha-glucanotransferase [Acetobacteraceae bacterium]|nr:4-alpha-glucanotransferase [Acetobacteraceae bacterium]
MSDDRLLELAEAAGLMPSWEDAFGDMQEAAPETLRRVLAALDLPADSDGEIADSLAQLRQDRRENLPPLVTAVVGAPIALPIAPDRFEIVLDDGTRRDGTAEARERGAALPAIDRPGYHHLVIGDREATLAVAPATCFGTADIAPGRRLWGLSAQLYGLRREGDGGIGDFAALRDFVRAAARHGAAAVSVSPVHAQFAADCDRFSPYAPSSRVMLNVLHADAGDAADAASLALEAAPLIAWPQAGRAKLARLRRAFDALPDRAALDRFRAAHGEALERHARFETLHAHIWGNDPGRWNWRSWPEPYRDPDSQAVADFARAHADDVAFHAWLQMRAEAGLDAAQAAARAAGMPIGLIADLAVGSDGGGSHCWSRQEETLLGLVVGAPPDLLSREGQNWGLTVFSPRGLRACGFRAFLEVLRASLRHAGGVRIDHVMGLRRLWVIPQGGAASDGVYLRFPFEDLLRLVALESHRHRAIVLGEDLGTVPEGFHERLREARVMGMRVMWFQREDDGSFRAPARWSPDAVAMTSTHDLPTVAGWWTGRDLDWRARLGLMRDEATERADRDRDRRLLWEAFRSSGSALDDAPPPEQGQHAAGSAAGHVGRTACALALLPLEDALAQEEQPNLPGTLHEHPNWQRRNPAPAHDVLDDPAVAGRLAALDRARRG